MGTFKKFWSRVTEIFSDQSIKYKRVMAVIDTI